MNEAAFRRLLALALVLLLVGCTTGEEIATNLDRPRMLPNPRGLVMLPEGAGPHPAVVLMHGCSGLDPAVRESLEAHARELRAHGFATLILDSFGPRGQSGGKVCASSLELAHARQYRLVDAFEALDFLAERDDIDETNIFLVGQSNGGSVALLAASSVSKNYVQTLDRTFAGVVAYYPWCGALPAAPIVTPLMMMLAGADDWTPSRSCQLAAERRAGAEPIEAVLYSTAHHSFDLYTPVMRYQGHTVGGNAGARTDSRSKMIAFFKRIMTE